MKLASGAWVVLSDGQKYLVMENKGDETIINLETIAHDEVDPDDLSKDGQARPGVFKAFARRRGAGEVASLHDIAEQRFVTGLAKKLDEWVEADRFSKLVIIADKTTLGTLRARLSDHVMKRVVAEIGKDIVHETTSDIEAFIQDD
jgi:protein required for attachment to host cells